MGEIKQLFDFMQIVWPNDVYCEMKMLYNIYSKDKN